MCFVASCPKKVVTSGDDQCTKLIVPFQFEDESKILVVDVGGFFV